MSNITAIPDIEALRRKLNPTPCGIVRELCNAGYEAYIVGGAIRDLLIGRTPKDYDISTSATPEEVQRVFGRRRCHVIGRRFRLAHVYANGDIYEISTFRRRPDLQERQGRKADSGPIIWNDNCFGTLEDDAQRRDFTANGLYFDVCGDRGLIDMVGGMKDIEAGIVRCIGEPGERVSEDPVRMLRALKLVGQFGFTLEPSLEKAVRKHSQDITLASPSRLFEELLKLLNHPAAWQTLQAMHDEKLLQYFWPVLDASWEEQEGEMVRNLLRIRGAYIRSGSYSNSRGLALSTVALPFMMMALNPEEPTAFWSRSAATDQVAHRALNLLFEGFKLPHILNARILDIIGLVPQMLKSPVSQRALRHKEYRYGRALVALLVDLFSWDPKILEPLPEFSPKYTDFQLLPLVSEGQPEAETEDRGEDDASGSAGLSAEHAAAKRKRRRRRRTGARRSSSQSTVNGAPPEPSAE